MHLLLSPLLAMSGGDSFCRRLFGADACVSKKVFVPLQRDRQ